jgi:Tol biopolymer transport system component
MKARNLIGLVLALALMWTAEAAAQQTAEELYQAGLYQEEVQGDLQGAIAVYQSILREHPQNRVVGAQAQLHIGLCLEKLGLIEARQAYRSVIDGFPEQRDVVAVAQERLASLAQELAELRREPTFTKIEIASNPDHGVLSPDGSTLAFVSDGGLWVVPIHGNVDATIAGEPVRIAGVDSVWDGYGNLAWSGDGRWIAVNGPDPSWARSPGDSDLVYVVPVGGGQPRVIHMPPRGQLYQAQRLSLSPDGGTLAFSALGEGSKEVPDTEKDRFIYSTRVSEEGSLQLSGTEGLLPAFSPDGQRIAFVTRRRAEDHMKSDLWLVPASGGDPVGVISTDSGRLRGPVWSPGGDFIATHYEPGLNNVSTELWVISVNSTDPRSSLIKIQLPNRSMKTLAGWTPDDRLGVFLTTPQEPGAAYTVPASGGKAVRVTPELGTPDHLVWSPAGDRIYQYWDYGDPQASSFGIGSIPAGGGEVSVVPLAPDRDSIRAGPGMDVSPDGREIVFSGGRWPRDRRPLAEDLGIWKAAVDGSALTQLTAEPMFDAFPRWSPDGRWIAFLRLEEELDYDGGNIQLIPSSGGEILQLTSNADSVAVANIAFSPDGTRVAYFSGNTIKVVPVQGGPSEVLVTAGSRFEFFSALAWSPDGSRIVEAPLDGKIWIDHLSSGERTELETGLSDDFGCYSVDWSPDGERIAFAALKPSKTEFWLISDFLPEER